MRHRPHVHASRRRFLARRPLGIVGVILALALLGCGCGSTVIFNLVRASHHR